MSKTSSSLARANRRAKVAELYLRGETQEAIADKLNVGQATISRDIATIHDQWVKNSTVTINEAKAKELARIDNLEIVYWNQYQASLQPNRRTMTRGFKMKPTDDPSNLHSTVTITERNGDPRYLDGIKWCVEQRCKILGLYHSSRIEISWRDSVPPGDALIVNSFFEEASLVLASKLAEEEEDDVSL